MRTCPDDNPDDDDGKQESHQRFHAIADDGCHDGCDAPFGRHDRGDQSDFSVAECRVDKQESENVSHPGNQH